MACKCVNEDGTRSGFCRGCTKATIVIQEDQSRPIVERIEIKEVDGLTQDTLTKITEAIKSGIRYSLKEHDVYIKAYKEGFKDGLTYSREHDDY